MPHHLCMRVCVSGYTFITCEEVNLIHLGLMEDSYQNFLGKIYLKKQSTKQKDLLFWVFFFFKNKQGIYVCVCIYKYKSLMEIFVFKRNINALFLSFLLPDLDPKQARAFIRCDREMGAKVK